MLHLAGSTFPAGIGFVLVARDANGPVVLEVGSTDTARALSVQAGRYFVRGRGEDYLLEGELTVTAATLSEVDLGSLRRVEYAQLVRKGGRDSGAAHGPQAGFLFRSPLPNAETSCLGARVGYAIDFKTLSTALRLGGCKSESRNSYVDTDVMEYDVELALGRAWDVHRFTFEIGVAAGLAVFAQRLSVSSVDETSYRRTSTPFFGIDATPSYDVWSGFYAGGTAGVATSVLRLQDAEDSRTKWNASVAARLLLVLGKRL